MSKIMEEAQEIGAEFRRLNVVYFLCRKGRIEQPHLFRVHHLSRNGVRLRDVKRWLGELRGRGMPESFAWSYKRRYKTGYVWQDLFDDDLITPVSDNEYVVKGSEISSSSRGETPFPASKKASSEIEEESPVFGSETSTLTDDSGKLDPEKSTSWEMPKQSPARDDMINEKKKKENRSRGIKDKLNEKASAPPAAAADSSIARLARSKIRSYSSDASSMFRNLMSCGNLTTNESAVMMINKPNKHPWMNISCLGHDQMKHATTYSAQMSKGDKLGGSQRITGTPHLAQCQWTRRKSYDGVMNHELKDPRLASAAYKPMIHAPNCSLCGKPFKPEKLHSHMTCCQGLKAISSANSISAHNP